MVLNGFFVWIVSFEFTLAATESIQTTKQDQLYRFREEYYSSFSDLEYTESFYSYDSLSQLLLVE